MGPGRTARQVLFLIVGLAVVVGVAHPVRADTSLSGSPAVSRFDTDSDGRADAVHVTQGIHVNKITVNITLEGHLFPPAANVNRSWSGWVDAALDTQTIACTSNAGCIRTFSLDLRAPVGGERGNYTVVLNVTTTDQVIGPGTTATTVSLEPRTGGSTTLPAAVDPPLMMVMGAAAVAAAAGAVWWLQRRPEKVEVKTGKGYFAETFQREAALRILEPFIRRGYGTLVISRVHPDEVKSMLPFDGVQPLWLVDYSDETLRKVDAIPPSLEKLFARASAFLEGSLRTAVAVDGLEFLIDNSNFSSVMRFLRRLIDIVAQRDSLLLATVAPNALGPKERSNLERELVRIPV